MGVRKVYARAWVMLACCCGKGPIGCIRLKHERPPCPIQLDDNGDRVSLAAPGRTLLQKGSFSVCSKDNSKEVPTVLCLFNDYLAQVCGSSLSNCSVFLLSTVEIRLLWLKRAPPRWRT